MTAANDYPFLREVSSPVTDDQLLPLDPRCRCVQFASPLTETDHARLAQFLAGFPGVPLRVYGHYSEPLPDLSFLKHYPALSGFQVDVFHLESVDGVEHLPATLAYFGFGQTKSKAISLSFLHRFPNLRELCLEGHAKHIEAVAALSRLERLTLRSITLPDLSVLLPLRQLWSLDLKLGGTKELRLLPRLGCLKYLELWMVKGLFDLSVIAEMPSLQNLFLQALKQVSFLPSFRKLQHLRRVTLDTMKGIRDLSPVAEAPALEELLVVAVPQLKPDDFRPFLRHPTLKAATVGLGSNRKNEAVAQLLGLPPCDELKSEFAYV